MNSDMRKNPNIQIESIDGVVSLFVPIQTDAVAFRDCGDLIMTAQLALLAYLTTLASDQLPVIA
jgi:hypothetical protein